MTTLAIAGIMHESNTFSDTPTDAAAFSQIHASNMIKRWGEAHHEIGGFIQGATEYDYTIYPMFMASAMPAGPVTDDVFDRTTEMLIQHLKAAPKHEGLLLALHGAMVVESYPDGDGEVLRRLRDALGQDFPIVVTLDQHTNVSEQMVTESTALVIYKTNAAYRSTPTRATSSRIDDADTPRRGYTDASTRQTADAPQYPVSRHRGTTDGTYSQRRDAVRRRSEYPRRERRRGISVCRCP